jgi:hypothetical protein
LVNNILKFQKKKNLKKSLDVGNDVFYQRAKFQLEITYILDCKNDKHISEVVNSANFETSKFCHFCIDQKYMVFRVEILHVGRVHHYKHLVGFFSDFFETSKCHFWKFSKIGYM